MPWIEWPVCTGIGGQFARNTHVGPAVPDEMLKRGGISIFGQSMAYVLARPLLMRIAPEVYEGKDFLDRTAAHILNFSWAGLLAIRAQWEDQK